MNNHPEHQKKIKLTDVECRCKNILFKADYLKIINSDFDYKSLEKEILKKS